MLLKNGGFEDGWYDDGNSQVPYHFQHMYFEYPDVENTIDPAIWSRYQLGETRVLHKDDIPAEGPHHIAIPNGEHMLKAFGGSKSIWWRLQQTVNVERAGVYRLAVHVLPDIVMHYDQDGTKTYADDPMSGRIKLFMNGNETGWRHVIFGEWQEVEVEMALDPGLYHVGLEVMGPHPVKGNNWFIDQMSFERLDTDKLIIEVPPGRAVKRIEVHYE